MMNKNDIIKLTKHVFKRGQGIPDRRLMHPVRDWWIGLSLSIVIVLCGGAWAAWQYLYYTTLDLAETVPEVQIIRYNAAQVERAIELYSPRAEEFTTTRPTPAPPQPAPEAEQATSTEAVATTTPELPEEESAVTETTISEPEPTTPEEDTSAPVTSEPTMIEEEVNEDSGEAEPAPTLVN